MTTEQTELAALRAENARLREAVTEYESAITWFTTCKSCADVLDASYRAHVEADRAKAKLDEMRWVADDAIDLAGYVLDEKLGNEATLESCRVLRRKARAVLEGVKKGTLLDRAHAALAGPDPSRMRVEGDWLVQEVDEHTCGTGPGGHYGAHEPGCGLVPVLDLSQLPGWTGTREDEAFVQAVTEEVWARTHDTFAVRAAEVALRKTLETQ